MLIDPARLAKSLRQAESNGSWNPCTEGRWTMKSLEAALALPVDPDTRTMRDGVLAVHVSDAIVFLRGEIDSGLIPSSVLESSRFREAVIVRIDLAPEMPASLRLAA